MDSSYFTVTKSRMPALSELWNPAIKDQHVTLLSKNQKQVDDNCPTILGLTQSAVMGISGAQGQIDKAKQTVQQANDTLQRDANTLETKVRDMTTALKSLRERIEAGKSTETDLKKQVQETTTLNVLRKEQSEELRKKYTSTFHTSWLGLWRPLKDTTPMGLIVASVVFGLIGVASVVFLVLHPPSGASLGPSGKVMGLPQRPAGTFQAMIGGFLKRLERL